MDTTEFYLNTIKKLKDKKEGKDEESLKRKKWQEEHYPCCGELNNTPHKCNCINADNDKGFQNRFVQHYPSSFTVENTDYFTLNFNTQEELLNCEYVSRWKNIDNFFRFSVSPRDFYCEALLMAEFKDGTEWWCLGNLKSMNGITLPKWEPIYKEK